MKLPIKKKYFDQIKSGEKIHEYRDAHITFICEETKEQLRKEVVKVELLSGTKNVYPDVLEDEYTICFYLKKDKATADNSDFKTATPKLKHS